MIDTIALIYEVSESMIKYKGVADMLVPFISRSIKLIVILTAISLLIKNFGEAESLGRFLAGLGILGIGISLAAQDSLKNLLAHYFSSVKNLFVSVTKSFWVIKKARLSNWVFALPNFVLQKILFY